MVMVFIASFFKGCSFDKELIEDDTSWEIEKLTFSSENVGDGYTKEFLDLILGYVSSGSSAAEGRDVSDTHIYGWRIKKITSDTKVIDFIYESTQREDLQAYHFVSIIVLFYL